VVLAGLNADRDPRPPLVVWGPERPEIRIGSQAAGYFETDGYLAVRESDERFEIAEQRRLLYVAATRAQDHLVVSLHHKPGYRNHAAILQEVCATCTDLQGGLENDQPALPLEAEDGPGPLTPVEHEDAAARWQEARADLLARVRTSGVVAPSGLGHDDVVIAEQDVRVPGRGEGGSARGRAVHAVLASVTLPGWADLDDLARFHAEEEGLGDRAAEVAAIARAALAAPVVRRALAAPRYWRELAVVATVAGRLVEGYIDLAFEADDGRLVVVDYKTDAVVAPERYRLQIGAYAVALARATGRGVSEGWLVFAGLDGAEERAVEDLDAAVAEVEASVGA